LVFRPAEIFFSAKFSLPPKKLPFPALIFEGKLKTRQPRLHAGAIRRKATGGADQPALNDRG